MTNQETSRRSLLQTIGTTAAAGSLATTLAERTLTDPLEADELPEGTAPADDVDEKGDVFTHSVARGGPTGSETTG